MEQTNQDLPIMQYGSRMTVEQERDALKEKNAHLKVMVQDFQKKLHAQKIRTDGVDTISVLLKEAKQQVITLENQKRALETAVSNLQNRLANHGLNNSVTFEENELFIPGTSKQILDNLAKENTRLRNLLGMSGSLEDISKLHEALEKSQTTCSSLQIERDNLQVKVSDLENMLKTSEDDKAKVISSLQDQIERFQMNSPTQDVLHQPVVGEVTRLRQKLKDVVLHCKQLETKLEDMEQVKRSSFDQEKSFQKENKQKLQVKDDVPDGNILLEENTKLKEELKTLKEMNRRWQEYSSGQERYYQDLHSKCQELELKYKNSQENRLTEEQERSMNKVLEGAREKLEKMAEEKKKVEERLCEQGISIQAMSSEIQRLQSIGGGDPETITALKAQIQVCTEDFETERRDRAKASAKVHQLSEEVFALRQENNQLKARLQAGSAAVNQPVAPQHAFPYSRHQSVASEMPQLQARGFPSRRQHEMVVSDGVRDEEDGIYSEDRITSIGNNDSKPFNFRSYKSSGPVSLPVMRESYSYPSLSRKKTEDTLCCPKCSQEFSEQEHDKLLEHMDICCE